MLNFTLLAVSLPLIQYFTFNSMNFQELYFDPVSWTKIIESHWN